MKVDKFKTSDLAELMVPELAHMTPDDLRAVAQRRHSYTVRNGEGVVIFCGGLADYWPGRAEAWGAFRKNIQPEFLAIHRIVKRFLDLQPVRRIEASVVVGFEQGHRWLSMLGFEPEAKLARAYLPNGDDCSLYSRVGVH